MECYCGKCTGNYSDEEEDELCICFHCFGEYKFDEVDKLIISEDGKFLCNYCSCNECGKLRELNISYNGVEILDEEFFEIKEDKFICKKCYDNKITNYKERLIYINKKYNIQTFL